MNLSKRHEEEGLVAFHAAEYAIGLGTCARRVTVRVSVPDKDVGRPEERMCVGEQQLARSAPVASGVDERQFAGTQCLRAILRRLREHTGGQRRG